jgi:NAD(P)-dependent dehydrogenase (short-subunit alcohol dehydrogenase family)
VTTDTLNRFDLTGTVAAVTGGGGALCGAMAEALGAAGVKVAILDVNSDTAKASADAVIEAGGQAMAFGCSVLDTAGLRESYDTLCRRWGPPDFLINGAGGNDSRASTSEPFHETGPFPEGGHRSFFDLDPAGFQDVFGLNFFGTFLTTQVFSKGMVDKGRGSIVNISSMAAGVPLTKVAAYSAAKAAVSNFTRWLAVHFSHTGVRVNALAPGFFMTEQLKFLHIGVNGEPLPRAKQVIAHTPMGRYGRPEDLIGALFWLLSEAASFVTGVVVPIDGGFSAYSI